MPALLSTHNVRIAQPTAGLGARLGAAVVDGVFIGIYLSVIISFDDLLVLWLNRGWVAFFYFVIMFFVPLLQEVLLNGRSLGKRCFNLRVVSMDGSSPRLLDLILRALLLWVDVFMSLGLGLMLLVGTKHHRRLGDFAAGTFVVSTASLSQQRKELLVFDPASEDYQPRFPAAPELSSRQVSLIERACRAYRTSEGHFDLRPLCEKVALLVGAPSAGETPDHYLRTVLYDYRHAR